MNALNTLLTGLERVTGRQVAIGIVLTLAGYVGLYVFGPGRGLALLAQMPLPDMLGAQLANGMPRFLEAVGPDGRSAYQRFLPLDFAFALLFAVTFAATIAVARKRYEDVVPPTMRYVALIPLATAVLDLIENIGLFSLTSMFPSTSRGLATTIGLLSAVRLALMNIAYILGLVAIFALAHRAMRAAEQQE